MQKTKTVGKAEYKGYEIIADRVNDCKEFNPREYFKNLGTMFCLYKHAHKTFGDIHNLTIDEVKKIAKSKDYITLPLFMYNYTYVYAIDVRRFIEPKAWVDGQIGLIAVSKEKIQKEFGWQKITKERKEIILDKLAYEAEMYYEFLLGNVFKYAIKKDGRVFNNTLVFYGTCFEANGLLKHARKTINSIIESNEIKVEQMEMQLI